MKKLLAITLALTAVILLPSCKGGNGSATTTSPSKTDTPSSGTTPAATKPDEAQLLEKALSFELNESGDGYIITRISARYRPGTNAGMVLPAQHEGLPVVEIGNNAFTDFAYFGNSIVIPEGVTRIGNAAFGNCASLMRVTLPSSLTEIGYGVFHGAGLMELELPAGVTKLGEGAFCWCNYLESVEIPASLIEIAECCFTRCAKLESITVVAGNPRYSGAGNCLIEIDSKTLIAGCKNSVIPSDGSVAKIGRDAFAGLDLKDFSVPNGVNTIGEMAFFDCQSLESITLPADLTQIDEYAFYGCDKLTDVYFAGTEEQWNAITIGGDNDALASATIHFNAQ